MFNFNLAGPASGQPMLHSAATSSKSTKNRCTKWVSALVLIAVILFSGNASAQLTLGTSPYNQNFDGIGSGLPTGWTVRTGATASALGTSVALTTTATAWTNATGRFDNVAAPESPLTSASNATAQSNSTDRALAVRQSGSFGDPGAAFVLQIANTTGLTNFNLTFNLGATDPSVTAGKTTTWNVDYGFGATPTSFTNATTSPATLTTVSGNGWASTAVSVNFGTALDNNSGPVWIRVSTKATAAGATGTRQHSTIDDFNLSYSASTPTIASTPTSLTYAAITVGTSSTSQSVSISGSNLTNATTDVTVAASSTDYQVSTDNSTWSSSVLLPFTGTSLTGTTVYVRFTPQTATGTILGSLNLSGGGVSPFAGVSLSGTSNPLINPTLTTSGTFPLAFGSVVATGTSTSQSFNLSGTDLQSSPGDITITAPSTNYQVSADNSTWGPTALIPYTSSTLVSTPVYVRFTPQAGGTFNQNVTMSGGSVITTPTVALTGTGLSPLITLGTSLTKLFTDNGTPSSALNYTVSGSSLGDDITITAPAGFEIKKSTDATYSTSIVLTQTAGAVASTTINVRLTGAASGYFAGNITHVSAGATTQNRAANGIVSGYLSNFDPNNVIVVHVGNGATLNAAAARTYLVEYSSTTGLPIQAILMPLADSGVNQTFTSSGSATTEGHLTLSPDGYYLALAGYDAAEGTASVNGTSAATVNRVIARVTNTTAINTTTTISDGFSTGSIRSAVANGAGSFYTAGSTGGAIRYSVLGNSTSTLISAAGANQRGINIINGQLYSSTGAGSPGIGSVGSGLPISTGNSITNITTTATDAFIALDLSGVVSGADVIYAAQGSNIGKYYYNGSSWTAAGTISVSSVYGITGRVVSGQAEIWYTTTGGVIGKITDTAAYNATITGTATPMFSSNTTNQLTRGISFGPACAPVTWYQDLDGDTSGNLAVTQSACLQPVGYVSNSTDCNDNNASVNPGASEGATCDNIDNDCNGQIDDNATLDPDNDGYSVCEGDCNNNNNTVYPGALEICDGLDNNCNTSIDETPPSWYFDADGDGYGAGSATASCTSPGAGYVSNNTDCNDSDVAINPATVWYQDADNDNYTSGTTLTQCTQPVGYKLLTSLISAVTDCNDANAAVNPATIWYQDFDGDTYGNVAVTLTQCTQPVGYVSNSTDCNDQFATVKPGATETACDGFDNNCNGNIDEGSVTGCTDPAATANYNPIATCDDGSCLYPWSFTAGHLVVSRVGTGTAALSGVSTAIYLDQYNPTTAGQSNPVHSFPVPKGGTRVLTTSGSSTAEGQLSRATDGQSISLAGYGAYPGVSSIASTTSAQYARVAGSLGINYQWSRPISTSSVYSANNARGVARNGANYWTTGSNDGVYYMGTGTPSQLTLTGTGATLPSNNRTIQVHNNNLFFSTGSGTTARGIWKVGSSLPTSGPLADSSVPQLIATGSTSSPYAFQFNADETVCYIADDRTANGGIMKYSYNGTAWTFVRTMSMGTTLGASGVYVDFYSGPDPIVYAIIKDAAATVSSLVRFEDTNTSTPTLTTLATAGTNQAFRSVVLAPCNDVVWYRDADGDGYGDLATTLSFCTQPYGYVSNSTDCDDTNAEINPATVWHRDLDGDGYASSNTLTQCARPTDYYLTSELVATSGDCNDNNAAVNAGATEICNSIDDDCNTQIDENLLVITPTVTGSGSISPSSAVSLGCGDSQTFTFTPNACYEISDVLVDGISAGALGSYTFTNVTGDHNIEVIYTIIVYPITVTTSGLGTYNAQSTVTCGNNTNIFITAGDCYSIDTVILNGDTVHEATNTSLYQLQILNVTEAPVVEVTYVIQRYNVTTNITSFNGSSATITPSQSEIAYDCGSSATYTINPDPCSTVINVLLNGISQGAVTSLTINDIRTNHSIFVITDFIDYTVTASANTGGTISNTGTTSYQCGASPTYAISALPGYGITGVFVDGSPVGALTSYTFGPLSANHTISVIFTPEAINNSWANAQSTIAPIFPSCASVSGSLAGCNPSSEASYVSTPIGAGQDAWYRFTMPVSSSGSARIVATSATNNIAIILQQVTSTSPFYTAVAIENASNTIGGEQMTISGLTPGATYKIGIKNMDIQAGGSFTLCVSPIRANTCGTISSPTVGKSLCDAFLGTYTGAQQYVFTFTNTTNSAEVFTHTNTGIAGGAASSAVVLSSIPGLVFGQNYFVQIDAQYTFSNATGATTNVTVPGISNSCTLYMAPQPNTELANLDWCGNGAPKRFNSFISTSWVCGAVDYQWEITPTTGLPIAQTTMRGTASRYILVNSLVGIHGGASTFNVRVRPVFSDGIGGTRFGSWSAVSRQLCILAAAGLEENNQVVTERSLIVEPSVEAGIYPNPNRGDFVNINMANIQNDQVTVKVIDAMGQLVINKTYSTEGTLNTILHFEKTLASGVYMIEMIDGSNVTTSRMVVQK